MKLPYYMQVKFSWWGGKQNAYWAIFQSNTIELNGAVSSYPSLLHSSSKPSQPPFPSDSLHRRLEILEEQVSCWAAGQIWKTLFWMARYGHTKISDAEGGRGSVCGQCFWWEPFSRPAAVSPGWPATLHTERCYRFPSMCCIERGG